ncbi:hypothetical protein BA6E_11124 [Bacteroidales bacterium 6E]|jgi:hypothetical protein|nr:hypothetical protein BA6E_11124 [Bacteroidales bacterium 6E]
MKRDFSKQGHREKIDKVERRAAHSGAVKKEKSTKRRLSIYDEFDEDDMEDFDPRVLKELKHKR